MTKFNVGDNVRILEDDKYLGRLGYIVEHRTGGIVLFPWLVKFDDGDCKIYNDSEIELVENYWMSKEEALCLAIKGTKVVNENSKHPKTYVDFNGINFVYHNGEYGTTDNINFLRGRWRIYKESVQPPKFPVDSFVVEDDGDYWRVLDVQSVDGHYEYYLSHNQEDDKDNCYVLSEDKLCLPKSTSSQPTSSQNVQGGNA